MSWLSLKEDQGYLLSIDTLVSFNQPVDPDESNKDLEVSVMSLKSIDESKKIFIPKEEDVSFVPVKNVLGITPAPELFTQGDRIRYTFSKNVGVFEL